MWGMICQRTAGMVGAGWVSGGGRVKSRLGFGIFGVSVRGRDVKLDIDGGSGSTQQLFFRAHDPTIPNFILLPRYM